MVLLSSTVSSLVALGQFFRRSTCCRRLQHESATRLRYFMAGVGAENRVSAHFFSVKFAWATITISTLAFFGDRCEDFRRIGFVEFLEHDPVCDCLFNSCEDCCMDRSKNSATFVALERDLVSVLVGHDEAAAVDTSGSMGNVGPRGVVGGHVFNGNAAC